MLSTSDSLRSDTGRERTPLSLRAVRMVAAAHHQVTVVDLCVSTLLILASLVGLIEQDRLGRPQTILFCVLLPLPVLLHRHSLRWACAMTVVVALVQWLTSTPQIADAAVLLVFFWLLLDGRLLDIALGTVVVEAGAIMAALRWSPEKAPRVWVAVTGFAIAAGAIGLVVRERRALLASVGERAARLEMERDQSARLAASAERARIAREMHDVVSHNLTVMIGLADGARYALGQSPEHAEEALERVSGTGRQALREMRRLLGVLRDGPEAELYAPQPGLAQLGPLLDSVRAAGLAVSSSVQGDLIALPSGLQLAVYRIAQEALTNVLKHAARPASADLRLAATFGELELAITSVSAPGADRPHLEDQPGAPDRDTDASGRGLSGMRERATAYGGELRAGPVAGGWQVRLMLPLETGARP